MHGYWHALRSSLEQVSSESANVTVRVSGNCKMLHASEITTMTGPGSPSFAPDQALTYVRSWCDQMALTHCRVPAIKICCFIFFLMGL